MMWPRKTLDYSCADEYPWIKETCIARAFLRVLESCFVSAHSCTRGPQRQIGEMMAK